MTIEPLEAENAVVGSILIDASCLEAVSALLRPEDLVMEINQTIYRAALALDRAGTPVDPVTVLEEALRRGTDISSEYIYSLMDMTPTAANAELYAKAARDAALGRRLSGRYERGREALAAHTPPQEELRQALLDLEALEQEGVSSDLLTPDEAAAAFYAHRERLDRGEGRGYLRTGYQDLDQLLGGGMLASGMYVLAARPGVGKTTLAINIADRCAQNMRNVLFVSLEMDVEQMQAKRLARETGIPSKRLLMDRLTEEEWARVAEATQGLSHLPVYLNQRIDASVSEIAAMARRCRGLALIVIDYLGKVTPEDPRRSRYEYTTEISGAIKSLARRFRVPVLALCQLSRAPDGRKDPTPILSDLRDSGAVEQDADGVIFLSQAGEHSQAGAERIDLRLIVAKNRHGATGECQLAFDMVTSKMTTSRRPPSLPRPKRQEKAQVDFWPIPDSTPVPF